jgi:hypothetical protein
MMSTWKKDFHQDLVVDVNAYAIADHLLMVIVVIVRIHMQQEAIERK